MKITYLYHSSFIIELDHHILLFDYYQGHIPTLPPNKPLYIFVSHQHYDHYNPQIYQIKHPNITYIIDHKIDNLGITVKAHHQYKINDLNIQTLLSTDEGVAYVIEVENKHIYHAGDLNWWHWFGEAKEDNDYQKTTFKKEINKITDISFDLMMIPLDPRLEQASYWGMNYILENIKTSYVLPMHFTDNPKKMLETLDEKPLNQYPQIIKIHHENETFNLGEAYED